MKKNINKADNYFERIQQKSHPPNFRYYFFDYLYFKGEQWNKKAPRCSGAFVLCEYWMLVVAFPAFGFTNEIRNFGHYAVTAYHALLVLFPFIFPFIRYRKNRKMAILRHYRHSKSSGPTMSFIIILPFVLFFFEVWLFDRLGWLDCKL